MHALGSPVTRAARISPAPVQTGAVSLCPSIKQLIGEWACYPNLRRHHGGSSAGSCSSCSYYLRASHNPTPILGMPRKRTAVG